jgi:hypothetical protein
MIATLPVPKKDTIDMHQANVCVKEDDECRSPELYLEGNSPISPFWDEFPFDEPIDNNVYAKHPQDIRANVVYVHEQGGEQDGEKTKQKFSQPRQKDGMVIERFYADTGANRSIYPNMRAASTFYRVQLDIGTAQGANAMKWGTTMRQIPAVPRWYHGGTEVTTR